MKEIAIIIRCLQFFTHNAHNLVARSPFFADHEFLGELYPLYESAYDSVIERFIGLHGAEAIDLNQIQVQATQLLLQYPCDGKENSKYFEKIIVMEQKLREKIKEMYPSFSIGSQQLFGDLADKSEGRAYQLKQRIKK
jgi:DNA-binding ferritin-like protein